MSRNNVFIVVFPTHFLIVRCTSIVAQREPPGKLNKARSVKCLFQVHDKQPQTSKILHLSFHSGAVSLVNVGSPVWQLSSPLVSSGSSELIWREFSLQQDAYSEEAPPHADTTNKHGHTCLFLMNRTSFSSDNPGSNLCVRNWRPAQEPFLPVWRWAWLAGVSVQVGGMPVWAGPVWFQVRSGPPGT